MWKYNKGEWSEIYTFAYLLSDGVLYSADSDLNKIEDVYFPILKILRDNTDYLCEDKIRVFRNNTFLKEVDKGEFSQIVETMLPRIKNGQKTFEIPEAETFFSSVYCDKVKASSTDKRDITIQIKDINTGISPVCGFSIKSFLGSKPTLVNAGNNTLFTYALDNCNDRIMDEVNGIETHAKIIDRFNLLDKYNCNFRPVEHGISQCFEGNLQFIDTVMPTILQYLLLYSYKYKLKSIPSATDKLKELNPLTFSNTELYTYKIKKMLCACALGMTPGKTDWLGKEDANGGYITVKSDGSVVCYHIYNRSEFEDYLFNHTGFDSPDMSRYNYAKVYKENDKFKMNLCLQIRFN